MPQLVDRAGVIVALQEDPERQLVNRAGVIVGLQEDSERQLVNRTGLLVGLNESSLRQLVSRTGILVALYENELPPDDADYVDFNSSLSGETSMVASLAGGTQDLSVNILYGTSIFSAALAIDTYIQLTVGLTAISGDSHLSVALNVGAQVYPGEISGNSDFIVTGLNLGNILAGELAGESTLGAVLAVDTAPPAGTGGSYLRVHGGQPTSRDSWNMGHAIMIFAGPQKTWKTF